ncbi:hypothetical protein EUX98_g4708 [Antrodiella citrinella]|uniref:Uncharacterized protein n=1 Tax=Antrodiella citrinella TaxID=2447956 RepID=A0A4S4MW37_9APHY|nr:hypothetical protein EUX98_g4708 [Antrodiella citrinella]
MRFSTAVVLVVTTASTVPSFAAPLEARRARGGSGGGHKLEQADNVAGIADGLSGIATNVYGATQARDLTRFPPVSSTVYGPGNGPRIEARRARGGHSGGNHLEDINNAVGIADGVSGVATNVYGATQRRDLEARGAKKGGSGGSSLENANNAIGVADGLSGVATNIYGATQPQQRDLEARRGHSNTLEDINDVVGVADDISQVATQKRYLQDRSAPVYIALPDPTVPAGYDGILPTVNNLNLEARCARGGWFTESP